jgi:hypothetical protein
LLSATIIGTPPPRGHCFRLRHDAIIGGDDEDGDIRDLAAAGTHSGERFVAGGVEEGNPLFRDAHLVGADVLRHASRFALGDVARADLVEEAGLAVVDVTHDGHRRPRLEFAFSSSVSFVGASTGWISIPAPWAGRLKAGSGVIAAVS